MKTRIVIEATTAAAEHIFQVTSNNPVTIIGFGWNSGTDVVPVEVCYGEGESDLSEPAGREGSAIELDILNNPVTVFGPGKFKINKGITSESIGVSVSYEQG